MRTMAKTVLILATFLLLVGCNPFLKVGKKLAVENRKNVEYLSDKLSAYYQKDLKAKILKKDDVKDRMVAIDQAKAVATKIVEAVSK